MRRRIEGSVVVVVGASSGVGRATAELFAERGARLVLAARSAEPLRELGIRLNGAGAEVLEVPTDIGDPRAADHLARRAVERFGRIDTWVNTAAVLIAAPFGTESEEEVERLVRTNILGQVWGARAAWRQFQAQEGGGVLIDVSSMLGMVPNPLVPLYTMSKFAVRGLSLSLHHLSSAVPGVRTCVILPGPIDTPMFDRAANRTGHDLRAIPPALAPERVAGAIVSCARRPRRQVVVGVAGKAIYLGLKVVPAFTQWFVARAAAAMLTRDQPAAPTSGRVLDAAPDGQVQGGYRVSRTRRRLGRAFGRRITAAG